MTNRLFDLAVFLAFIWIAAPRVLDWSDRRAQRRREPHFLSDEFFRGMR